MSSTFNVTVIERNATTRLYQTSRPHERLHGVANMKSLLDDLEVTGQIASYDDSFGNSIVQVEVRNAPDWGTYEDAVIYAVVIGTATPDDDVFVYDRGSDVPRQTGTVMVNDQEQLHYWVQETASI